MTDATAGESATELEAAAVAPVLDEVPEIEPPAPAEPVAASPSAERALPEIEHPIGPIRQAILDHLVDSEGPQTVAQIIAGLGNYSRSTVEVAVLRELRSGRIERIAPGTYRLAPAKPPEPPKRPSPPPPPTPEDEATWFAAFDTWINDPETWDRERFGPRPNEPGRRIPAGVVAKGVDRNRKRLERQRDREAVQARQSAADRELRDRLLAACNGNYSASLQVDDLAPIREVLKTVPLDRVIMTIRQKVDRRCYPANPPLSSWRDQSFLRALAEEFCRAFAIPGLVREWGNAGRTPATKAPSSPLADDMPDDNIDRSRHDQEHAPPGPHSLSKSPMDEDADAVPSVVPDVPANAADASEAPTAVSVPPV